MENNQTAIFKNISALENLFSAWREFRKGKYKKIDVIKFQSNLKNNLYSLHYSLIKGEYQHGFYQSFFVFDPKKRHIHKAPVRDRLLHHAIVRAIEPIFEPRFIFDSYSCRKGKGVHSALERFHKFGWKLSQNNTKTVWILKCDVKIFFQSIDHAILKNLLARRIWDERALNLLEIVVDSFNKGNGTGLPLGNLTSQLFANIYLNELDQLVKNKLRAKHYVRYCDDFVILERNRESLADRIGKINDFLLYNLKLELHPNKVFMRKYHQGIDFLGFINFPHHRILRTKTKHRMFRKLRERFNKHSFISYLGLVKHSRSRGVRWEMVKKII